MNKAVHKELRKHLLRLYREEEYSWVATIATPENERKAWVVAQESQYITKQDLEKHEVGGILTAKGYAFVEQSLHPIQTWMKQNWFPLVIALSTFLVASGSLAVDVYSLLAQ